MNYIYDIILNFNEEIYDFYEWNNTDKLTHIRKIPIIKVNSIKLQEIKQNKIDFSTDILEKTKYKTEIFNGRKIVSLENAFLLSNGLEVIAINIKNKKNLYSKLTLTEEKEVLEVVNRLNENDISYKLISKFVLDDFKTRKEKEIYKYVLNKLNQINKESSKEKLKYIYYECFSKKDSKDMYKELIEKLNFNYMKLYEIFKLIKNV